LIRPTAPTSCRCKLIDAITGMIAVGLLTRGADNDYGRLIEELGIGTSSR